MRILGIAIVGLMTAAAATPAAQAQSWGYDRGDHRQYQRAVIRIQRECNRGLRRADTRREYAHIQRECRRDLAELQREYRRQMRRDRRDWRDHDRRWDRRDRDDDDDDDD